MTSTASISRSWAASLSVFKPWEAGACFLFNPVCYASLGLAVCEAMAVGLPVVGLATTKIATAVENGRSGYVSTDLNKVLGFTETLLADPDEARRLGNGAREAARERFGIGRFCREWEEVFASLQSDAGPAPSSPPGKRLTSRVGSDEGIFGWATSRVVG